MKQKRTDMRSVPGASGGSRRPWAWFHPPQGASRGAASPSAGAQLPREVWGWLEPGHGRGHGYGPAADTAVLRPGPCNKASPGHTHPMATRIGAKPRAGRKARGQPARGSHLGPRCVHLSAGGTEPQRLPLGMAVFQPQEPTEPSELWPSTSIRPWVGAPQRRTGKRLNTAVETAGHLRALASLQTLLFFLPQAPLPSLLGLGTLHLLPSSRSGSPRRPSPSPEPLSPPSSQLPLSMC